jgi:hypothetical protein
MARPVKPMFPQLAPLDAAADGAVSVEEACAKYLGGMSKTAFYALVGSGEIELIHEGRKPTVPVRQLVLRLARKIEEERNSPGIRRDASAAATARVRKRFA